MPKIVTMEFLHESDPPSSIGGGDFPESGPSTPGTDSNAGSGQESITPERLKKIIQRLDTGFYDGPEVREHLARRIREELGP